MVSNAIEISHEKFMRQWIDPVSGNSNVANRLSFNIEEFLTKAGEFAKRRFINSFLAMGFDGKPWQPRLPHNKNFGEAPTHPLMNETGALKNGIKGSYEPNKSKKYGSGGSYWIRTTEEQHLRLRGKRVVGVSSGAIGYAAIHNSDPATNNYTVNQYSSNKPIRRQFIGYSHLIDGYIFENMVDRYLLKDIIPKD